MLPRRFWNAARPASFAPCEGAGPPLVLQHGFTSCLEDWFEEGYAAAFLPEYQLILIDARGHGGSDKLHDAAAYTLDRRVADVTVVLDALRIETADFWRLRSADLHAWLAAVEDRVVGDVPETMAMPCFLYAGESDPIFAPAPSRSFALPGFR